MLDINNIFSTAGATWGFWVPLVTLRSEPQIENRLMATAKQSQGILDSCPLVKGPKMATPCTA